MDKLFILNTVIVLIVVGILILLKKFCKTKRSIYIIFLIFPILTILCHYSSFLYYLLTSNGAMAYLKNNPNLLLPIYPCNLVMWLSLVFGIIRNKESKFGHFLIDYLFWFGLFSSLIGMFANVDFIKNPTLKDYEITKSIVAHGFLLLNALALPMFGFVKIKLERNLVNILISVGMMFSIGLYCNLLIGALVSYDNALDVNSMFILHSPFSYDDKILTFPTIAFVASLLYFVVFMVCEQIVYKPGNRWYNRISKKNK